MLHSISYLISGIVLFSMTVFPTGVLQADDTTATLHGAVVEAESHEPIEAATVSIAGQEASTETERDGSFIFNELNLGEYTLIVTAEGYDEKEVEVSLQSSEKEVIIELQPAY